MHHHFDLFELYAKKRAARKNKKDGNPSSSPHNSAPPAHSPSSPFIRVHSMPPRALQDDSDSTKDRNKYRNTLDIQQQFFKSLTNDLIKTSGSVFLKPITSAAQRQELEGDHPSSNPNSPASLRKKPTQQTEDDKAFQKRQMSKTLDPPSISRTGSPPPAFLSCSAPAQANSGLSSLGKPPSSPPPSPRAMRASPPSSPRAMRASNGLSPVPSRRSRGSPAAIVVDMALARAALNPAGLPMSPPASPTSTSSPNATSSPLSPVYTLSDATVSPKPIRPAEPPAPTPETSSSEHVEHLKEPNTSNGILAPTAEPTEKTETRITESTSITESTETITPTPTDKLLNTTETIEVPQTETQTKEIDTKPDAPETQPNESTITHESTQEASEPTTEVKTETFTTGVETGSTISEDSEGSESEPEPEPEPEPASVDNSKKDWAPHPRMDVFKPRPYPTRPTNAVRPTASAFIGQQNSPSSNASPSSSSPSTASPSTSTPTPPTSTPTHSPSSSQSSLALSWTSYKGSPGGGSRIQPRTPHARPVSTIGIIRYSPAASPSSSPSSASPSVSNFSQYATNPSLRSPAVTVTPSSDPASNPSMSPNMSRTPSPNPPSLSSSELQASTEMLPHFTGSSTPTTPSIINSATPPHDSLLLPPLTLAGSYSPSPSPVLGGSPNESPRNTPTHDCAEHARRVTESPRGWGMEDIAITTGWRSPTVSYMPSSSTSATPSSPRQQARSSINHHRLTRTNSSMADLYVGCARMESPSPGSKDGERTGRPHAGSAGSTMNPGSGSMLPVRSSSEPHVPEKTVRSASLDQEDPNEQSRVPEELKIKGTFTRSTSAMQLKGNNNEYSDLVPEDSVSESRADLIYTHTRAGTKIVKAGTLNSLIEVLTYQKQSDPAFVDAFLLTYPSFTTPTILLEKLIERYNQAPPQDLTPEQKEEYENDSLIVRLRVCSVLKTWTDKHFYDFQKEPALVEKFVTFMESLKERGMEKVSGTIVRALQKKLDGSCKKITFTPSMPVPTPLIPKGEITFTNFDDLEVARQLTLMEYECYCCIRPRECLNQAWNKANKEEESANIVTMIRRSNSIPLWVATEIIKEDKLQRRVAVLKKFINVAEFCRQLNNFNAVMEIISGLNLTPVYRLRKTWDALPRKQIFLFDQLSTLMAPKGNFKVYREELHTKDPPCVPFLGRYLTDLTFIEDAAKENDDGMINFVKRMQLSVVIREIQQYQQTPYNLAVVPGIRDYLSKTFSHSESELYAQSRNLEPSTSTS